MKKYIKLAALLGAISVTMFSSGCSTERAKSIDGTIMKDNEGNLYIVKIHFGEVFKIEKIAAEDLF